MINENEKPSLAERLRESVSLKMAVVGFLILVLLIPVGMLLGVVAERSELRDAAAEDILRGWGGRQLLAGPLLLVPATVVQTDAYERRVASSRSMNYLPESLAFEAALDPQVLYRGIHDVPVYRATVSVRGILRVPSADPAGPDVQTLDFARAKFAMAVTDAAALRATPVLHIGGREIPFTAGGSLHTGWPPHIVADVGEVLAAADPRAELPFRVELDFTGGERLQFLPLADATHVSMEAPWAAPSFIGRHLPQEREVGDDGFKAEWQLTGLGRPLPAEWLDGTVDTAAALESAFGVELYEPVDLYQKTERATKYAVLFIGLSFVAYFLFETMGRFLLHPMQYLLVGFANALFYLLLLSLAEHIGFGLAYLASAVASILLVAGYSQSVLRSSRRAGVMAALLAGLYGFLYLVLRAEDYAMLAGAVGLWCILGTIMYLTRHVDWYRPGRRGGNDAY